MFVFLARRWPMVAAGRRRVARPLVAQPLVAQPLVVWPPGVRPFLAAILLAIPGLAISGCGFKPLHGDPDRTVAHALAGIEVGLIRDRTGQLIRNALLDRMALAAPAPRTVYRLDVTYDESIRLFGIRKNRLATRANLSLAGTFQLVNLQSGKVATTGRFLATSSYDNSPTQDFATRSAETDARRRAAIDSAAQITLKLAAFLSPR